MLVESKVFGEIEVDDAKIVTFEDGIIGFPDLKNFAIIYDEDKKDSKISWLQSMDEGDFALPVMNPTVIEANYDPYVEDELLKPLGELNASNLCVLVVVKVPSDIKAMSVNLKAPIVINVENRKGIQVIVEDDYPVRKEIYGMLKEAKEKAQEGK
ncbi:MAG: flagellar assembly protein FliW [Lachnospiraceae bacterium]|jgi:flagellar assembly factor FliW|nr:flagellar assembly protein FliW [Lachnospiraceae bacterium]